MAGTFQNIGRRLAHAWNAFQAKEKNYGSTTSYDAGPSYNYNEAKNRNRLWNERTIVQAIYARISMDVAATPIRHIKLNNKGRYLSDMLTNLNDCLTVEANIDQPARMFRQDMALTLLDRGVIAIVPVDTDIDPTVSNSYDIKSLRVGTVVQWYAQKVQVRIYNDQKGKQEELILPKSMVAIVENPLYSVVNEPNSTLQRLTRKLMLLDQVDEQSASGKLDLIIQLPYVVKTEARRTEAEKRLKEIEFQLKGSQYGIAYTDGTEKVTQLNRPAENNLMAQVEYLTNLLYTQLGLTPEIMNGTATESAMLNYWNRSVEPILSAITEAMHRTFLTKTARTQGQAIRSIPNLFKIIPITMKDLATIADKLSRNEIVTPNELRDVIGLPPSDDPNSDKLGNRNMPANEQPPGAPPVNPSPVNSNPTPKAVNGANGNAPTKLKELTSK